MMSEYEDAVKKYTYNPETGVVFSKLRRRGVAKMGMLLGKPRRAYQIAFLLMEGYIPETIDHKDGNRDNCKWSNLRAATRKQQSANTTKAGVYRWPSGVYYYQLMVDGKRYYETGFSTWDAANAAHKAKCLELQGDFAVQLRDE